MSISKRLFFCFLAFPIHLWAQLSTTLPIVKIDTRGASIMDEPKITADMQIIYKGLGQINSENDAPTEYNGLIGIEYRGSSSQMFPKKGMGVETRDEAGEDLKVSLFGWPEESDWVLFASYNEKSMLHNVFTLGIANAMGMYASRTQYVEVIINNQYQGVYVFMEKVKRDSGRVDISKLSNDENTGDDLTGGYIVKIDKETGTNNGGWRSNYTNTGSNARKTYYLYEYPSDISSTQRTYIKNEISSFEDVMASTNYKDPVSGYPSMIDVNSFVTYLLVNEISRNIDGYRISSYLYKDKDSKDGRLKAGPPWDYDICYGNADYCDGNRFDLWAYRFNDICPDDNWTVPFWWYKLMQDPAFVQKVGSKYHNLRKEGMLLNTEVVLARIDSLAGVIEEAQVRNYIKWPTLGKYVWPEPNPIPTTWVGEVNQMKNWLRSRLNWLDAQLPEDYTGVLLASEKEVSFRAFPNPFIERLQVEVNSPKSDKGVLQFLDVHGRVLGQSDVQLNQGYNLLEFEQMEEFRQAKIIRIMTSEKAYAYKVVGM